MLAAEVDQTDFVRLTAEARSKGITTVVVNLAPASLSEMSANFKGVQTRMAAKANALVAELGQTAWSAGREENGIGQMTLNVTEAGLKILQNSSNAVRFSAGLSLQSRSFVFPEGGSFDEIERQLASKGRAHIQVTLNIDSLEFAQATDGALKFTAPGRSIDAAAAESRALLQSISRQDADGQTAAMQKFDAMVGRFTSQPMAEVNPEFTLQVTREGLEKLATSKQVRSIKPVGFVDKRLGYFDEDAIAYAEKYGPTTVIITMRAPVAGIGQLNDATFKAQADSNRRMLQSVMAIAGQGKTMREHVHVGAVTTQLNLEQLKALKLALKQDQRILSVELIKALGSTMLSGSTSAASTNIVSAWNAGIRGAGQSIIVADTGVLTNHGFLKQAGGSAKVFQEFCFGSDFVGAGKPQSGNSNVTTQFRSICPGRELTGNGDSPIGQSGGPIGSAVGPNRNSSACIGWLSDDCSHGTHVAGIATGRTRTPYLPTFQGVANEANIVAVNVFSWSENNLTRPTFNAIDLLAMTDVVVERTKAGTQNNSFTVNMSLGGGSNTSGSDCGSSALTVANHTAFNRNIELLTQRGIPVVASTGNDADLTSGSLRASINWPACVKNVVKVGALDQSGTQLANYTRLANQMSFPGDVFWLAPGTSIVSSVQGPIYTPENSVSAVWETKALSGTSMAAPHVAGLYALIKSVNPDITVQGANQWIAAWGSQPMPSSIQVGFPIVNQTFRRILLPNSF